MQPKTKQTTLKTLNKISRIAHYSKSIKEKSEHLRDNVNEATGSNYNSATSYADEKSKEISKEAAYQAKELTVKRARKQMRLRTLAQKNSSDNSKSAYTQKAKRFSVAKKQKQNFDTFNAQKNKRLLRFFSFKRKPFFNPQISKYIISILSGSVVVMMLLIIVLAGVFSRENGSSFFGTFIMPFDNPESVSITSDYGYRIHPVSGERKFHSGIDFGTPHHCNIYAVAMGEVTFAGINGGYGNCVIIKHEVMGDTLYTLYAHLSQIKVKNGQTVMQGETIGIEGGSASDPNHGVSTGHHLHFEVRNKNNVTKNPLDYLPCGF